jgi:hypothetical protein
MTSNTYFRFYAELNEFLAGDFRHRPVCRTCPDEATVKHMIEAFGVPHTEVELILINGESVDFSARVRDSDHVSVYPSFGLLDISPILKLPSRPLRGDRFVADSHLGRLAKQLRMLGFDVLYHSSYEDQEIARISVDEGRIVLSRDRNLLMHKAIVRGCCLHGESTDEQVLEVLARLDLSRSIRPFTRCLRCNGLLNDVDKDAVAYRVPERSRKFYQRFFECADCKNIYWEGSTWLECVRASGKLSKRRKKAGRHEACVSAMESSER